MKFCKEISLFVPVLEDRHTKWERYSLTGVEYTLEKSETGDVVTLYIFNSTRAHFGNVPCPVPEILIGYAILLDGTDGNDEHLDAVPAGDAFKVVSIKKYDSPRNPYMKLILM